MRFALTFVATTLLSAAAAAVIDPQPRDFTRIGDFPRDENNLFKRKGGGGGGGARGGGGGSSGGGSRSGGSSGGGGSSSGGSRGSSGSGSGVGGTSRGGSGPPRAYGGGGFYGGGSAVPYRSGVATAAGVGALAFGAGALLFWPGTWLHGANLYPNRDDFSFYNSTTRKDERLPVVCGCAQDQDCSCDENPAVLKDLVGNGTYQALNKSIINVGDYKGRKTLLVNGTLPIGTTADDSASSAGIGRTGLAEAVGLWPVVACVLAVFFLP